MLLDLYVHLRKYSPTLQLSEQRHLNYLERIWWCITVCVCDGEREKYAG